VSLPGEIIQGILARAALVVLRVYLGIVFFLASVPRFQQDPAPEFSWFLEQVAMQRGHPFYQEFVRRVVQPNAASFAAVITWGELLVGVMLVLGLLTRFSAVFALLIPLSYMFAKGAWFWTPWSSEAAYVAIALALLIGAAGRTLGLDAFLARRWPRSPFW
jgi:thiosulfate dehydrogenase [quinone] large subunit